jgi:hypothetical protein
MITRTDWQAVHDQLMADERGRLGDPPTAEELLAYTRGELPAEEEARVRHRLVLYPDLVRTLTEPFPIEGAEPGDSDYLSDEEFSRHWASMQRRMSRKQPVSGARVLQFWRVAAALAAGLAIVFGTLLWQSFERLSAPRLIGGEQVLLPEGHRGAGDELATPLTAAGDNVALVLTLLDARSFDRYRFEILRRGDSRPIWSAELQRPDETSQSFAIVVPRRFLKPGTYQIVVYGATGNREERLAGYALRVPAQ